MPPMAASELPTRPARQWLSALATLLGALPDHIGQFRVASAVLRRLRPPHQIVGQRMRGGLRVALDLGDRTQGIAYLTRRYDPELVDFIAGRLPPGGTFVDVGAHVGLISLAVARRRPDAHVFGFEPCPANARSWLTNRELNSLANAELTQSAVADRPGRMAFHEDADSAAGYLAQEGAVEVDVTTLDRFTSERGIARIDVLKIDTEGGEIAVLGGAASLLAGRSVTTVVCELNAEHLARHGQRGEQVMALLDRAGLRPAALPAARSRLRGRRDTEPVVVDMAFELAPGAGRPAST